MTAEKEAHQVTTEGHLAANQHATNLQGDLEAVQQELAAQRHSCTMATEHTATLQTELDTIERTGSSLQGQLDAALQDLAVEQQRHSDVEQADEGLQSQLQGMQQELIAAKNATAEKAAAEQSVSSLHSPLETTQQLLRDNKEAHMAAVADLHSQSQAAQGSLEAQLLVAEQTMASLGNQLHEALEGSRSMKEVSTCQAAPMSAECAAAPCVHCLYQLRIKQMC